ncbi:MAG: hypothetical protein GY850_05265 [bacterium]|nr:hypothetical protein [bacterium]
MALLIGRGYGESAEGSAMGHGRPMYVYPSIYSGFAVEGVLVNQIEHKSEKKDVAERVFEPPRMNSFCLSSNG